MKMSRTPSQILSSLWHRDDYFKYVPVDDFVDLWMPKIEIHMRHCEHPKCKEQKELIGQLELMRRHG